MADETIIAIAIINAAAIMANAWFLFTKISFHKFSGVIFSITQKEKTRIKMPINEYRIEEIMYLI